MIKAFSVDVPADATVEERIEYTMRYVLENSELVKLWIDEFIEIGDIRKRFPLWDAMIAAFAPAGQVPDWSIDAEFYFINFLTSAIIGPRVLKNSVCPDADIETIVRRFRLERLRLLGARSPG